MTRLLWALVLVVAVASGIGAVLADGAPTALGWWNVALRFAAGFLIVVLASQARPLAWTLLVAPALALGDLRLIVAAALAYVIVLVAWFRPRHEHYFIGAIVGALAAQTLLRLPATWFFGFPSLVAAAVVAVTALSAWFAMPARGARILANSIYGLTVASLLALIGVVPALGEARTAAEEAADLGEAGIETARAGDLDLAIDEMTLAADRLRSSNAAIRKPWAIPARLLPVVSQHLEVALVGTDVGSSTVAELAGLARATDIDALTAGDATIDLSVVAGLESAATAASATLSDGASQIAAVRNPWLVSALGDPLRQVSRELDAASVSVTAAADATTVLPSIFGSDGPRRYLLMFGQPAEARESGGFMAVYAVLEVLDGDVEVLRSGRWVELQAEAGERDPVDDLPTFFVEMNAHRWPANLTGMPQMPAIAEAAVQILPTIEGAPLDGVVYVDPVALEAVLKITGPQMVDASATEGAPSQISASMIVDFLIRDQYIQIENVGQRHRYLASLLDTVIASATKVDLPAPAELSRIVQPVLDGNHFQLATLDDRENEVLQGIGLQRTFAQPAGEDFVAVFSSNTAPNKLDAYATREVAYEATVDPAGRIDARVTVLVTSTAEEAIGEYALGEAYQQVEPGEHRPKTIVYTPHEITGAWVDGVATPPGATRAFGMNRYTLTEIIPPGGSVELMFSMRGQVDFDARLDVDPDLDEYALRVAGQPLANPDWMSVEIRRPGGVQTVEREVIGDATLRWTNDGEAVIE